MTAHDHAADQASTRPRVGATAAKRTATRPVLPALALQRSAGNRAVTAALREGRLPVAQRSWLDDAASWIGGAAKAVGGAVAEVAAWAGERIGDTRDARGGDDVSDFDKDRAELQEWRAKGVRGPENLRAPTGVGGFGAAYDPNVQQLLIRLAGGVTFADSITFVGDLAVESHPQPGGALTSFVRQVNLLPEAERRTAAAPYMWTAAEQTAFLTKFNTGIANRWGGKHEFHASRKNWTDLGAKVDVVTAMHDGRKADDEHVSLTVYKTPPGGAGNIGVVRSRPVAPGVPPSRSAGATTNSMELNSPDVDPRQDNLLTYTGTFPAGSEDLDATGRARLGQIAATFRGGGPACRVCGVTILASSGGPMLTIAVQGQTESKARSRFTSMRLQLAAGGNADVALRTTFAYAGAGDAFTMSAGDAMAQTVAEHEAGHMFGLGDEYATGAGSLIAGTGQSVGGAVSHDSLVKQMGLEGAVHENNDGIMSLGSVVRPQHYATFHWALTQLTEIDWALGPPVPVTEPGPAAGDVPAPDRDAAPA